MKAERALVWAVRLMLTLGWIGLALWAAACPLLWIVRDGLGPKSRETTGWDAVVRFSPVLLVGLVLAAYLALAHLAAWWLRSTGARGGSGQGACYDNPVASPEEPP